MVNPEPTHAEDSAREPIDVPGVVGMFLAVLGGANLVAGMAIPLIPWILSALLVIPLLVLGVMARRPLKKWILLMAGLCLIPPVVLACVELLTNR